MISGVNWREKSKVIPPQEPEHAAIGRVTRFLGLAALICRPGEVNEGNVGDGECNWGELLEKTSPATGLWKLNNDSLLLVIIFFLVSSQSSAKYRRSKLYL